MDAYYKLIAINKLEFPLFPLLVLNFVAVIMLMLPLLENSNTFEASTRLNLLLESGSWFLHHSMKLRTFPNPFRNLKVLQ